MRVLLAQDQFRDEMNIEFILDLAGHRVTRAKSGKDAFRRYEADPFPVVISHLCTGSLDGFELSKLIRARHQTEFVYTMVVDGTGLDFDYQRADAAQVDDVLTYPLHPDMLRSRLRVAERMFWLYEELNRLRGLIPICAWCKNVRQERGLWQQMEAYVTEHSTAQFTHTICPQCAQMELDRASHSQNLRTK